MDWNSIFTAVKPILAQGTRDGLRLIGMGLATHGFVQSGPGVEAFVGAGMTLAGLFWGWFTTSGYIQAGALLKKLTAQHTVEKAVTAAQVLPPAAAVDTKEKAVSVQSVTKVLLVAFVLSAFLAGAPAFAQAKPRLTGDIVRDLENAKQPPGPTTRLTGNVINDLLGALDVKLLPDLQYAKALADASGSKVTAPCYQAWIDIINTRQNAGKNPDGTPIPMPDPHIVTDFEKMVELRNALQPESDFMIKCSPVASMVKKDIAGFIGIVLAGGTGLATLVPGL